MTTVSSATATNGTLTQQSFNPYNMFEQGSMAHDFWGSQIFGTGTVGTSAPQGNGSTASNIMQQYMQANGGSGVPTVQDYMTAAQIANALSGNIPMFYQNTSFFDGDMFAQQLQMPYSQAVNYSA